MMKQPKKTREDNVDLKKELINKNPCTLCRIKGLTSCRGHGAGAGADASSPASSAEVSELSSTQSPQLILSTLLDADAYHRKLALSPNTIINPTVTDFEKMNQHLAAQDFIEIHNEHSRGLFAMRPKLGLTFDEQAKVSPLFDNIQLTFTQFKINLKKLGTDVSGYQLDIKDNNLTLRIPSPRHYDAFLQLLVQKNLLARESLEHKEGKVAAFKSNSFVARSEPATAFEKTSENAARDERSFHPNPFKTSLRLRLEPWDSWG